MIREIKSHNIIKLTTYLQQSWNYQCPQNTCDIITHGSLVAGGDSCYVSETKGTMILLR